MLFEPRIDTSSPTMTILLDGTDVTEQLEIVSLETSRVLDRLSYAQIILRDGDPAAQTFKLSEGPLFAPGAELEILMGYNRNDELVFKGIVTRQRLDAPLHGSARLHVEARHAAFTMAHARKSRIWQEQTDADVITELADAHGVTFDGVSQTVRPVLVQHQSTDWDFAVMRAQAVGQAILANDEGLKLLAPEPEPVGTKLTYGRDLYSVEMELCADQQPAEFETGSWSASDQEVLVTSSAGPGFVGPGNTDYAALGDIGGDDPRLRVSGPRDQAELDEWAYADGVRRRMSAVRGAVEVQGAAAFQPGMTVSLDGLGARFNGPAIVTGVRHQYARGDWRSFLQIGLDPAYHREKVDVDAPGAGGLLPAIRGLQIGVVDALVDDPAGEERIAVKLATQTETDEPIWARVLSIGGGADRGLVLLPEINDEVLLGFLDDDPRDAVVLGGLHSSANANPYPGEDDNHIKGLCSRAGTKISFDDDKVIVTVETPGGQMVQLDDDAKTVTLADANNNSIVLDKDGITLTSGKDITLKATGDVKADGVNCNLKASAEVTAEGSAGASLKSSGQTTIKGSIVNIN